MGKKSSSKDPGSPRKGGVLTTKMRGMVSMNKVRYQEDGFDLDLTYITPRVIAMGFPSFGAEAYYRNPVDKVELFFNTKHKGKFRIYNLCSERKYDKDDRFGRNYKRFPFDDHNAPAPISIIPEFIKDVQQFLDKDPENVVAVHCKAGKGRTGVLVAAYLMASEEKYRHPQQALTRFASLRTSDGHGVTIPSQHRYVRYYDRMLSEHKGLTPPITPCKLSSISVKGGSSQWDLYVLVLEGPDRMGSDQVILYDSRNHIPPKQASRGQGVYQFDISSRDIIVRGDVKVMFYASHRIKKNEHLFHFWFHSSFIEPTTHTLKKEYLDRAAKDTKHQHFKPNLAVLFTIEEHRDEGRVKRAESQYYMDTKKEAVVAEDKDESSSSSSSGGGGGSGSESSDSEEELPAAEEPKPAAESPPAVSSPTSPPPAAADEQPPASPPETDSERSLREMRERMAARAREREVEKQKREDERKAQAAAREERLKAEAERRQREREEAKKKREKERQERLNSLSPRLRRSAEPTSPTSPLPSSPAPSGGESPTTTAATTATTIGSPVVADSVFPQSPATPFVATDTFEIEQQQQQQQNKEPEPEPEPLPVTKDEVSDDVQQQKEATPPHRREEVQPPRVSAVTPPPARRSAQSPKEVSAGGDVIDLAMGIINRVKAIEESCSTAMRKLNTDYKHPHRDPSPSDHNNKDTVSVIALSLLQRSARLEIVCLQESDHRKLKSLFRNNMPA